MKTTALVIVIFVSGCAPVLAERSDYENRARVHNQEAQRYRDRCRNHRQLTREYCWAWYSSLEVRLANLKEENEKLEQREAYLERTAAIQRADALRGIALGLQAAGQQPVRRRTIQCTYVNFGSGLVQQTCH